MRLQCITGAGKQHTILTWHYQLKWFCTDVRVILVPDLHSELATSVE